jgi:1-acyl-sn-glycerol-3-phosphate acyltransferase
MKVDVTSAAAAADPLAAERWIRYVRPIVRWLWRPRLDGVENLPSGPFMLVANHSGQGNAEIMSLTVTYLEKVGLERPLAPMVHPMSLNGWPQGGWMRRLGAIPSTYEAAEAALARGTPVLVFPGGDHEAMRPVWQANRVDFAGRQGFLKIARKANVPIVPLGIRGSHYTAPVVYRGGAWLPRALLLPWLMGFRKRFPLALSAVIVAAVAAALAIAGALPVWIAALIGWLFAASPLGSLPWIPWTIRMRIGVPIPARELFASPDGPLDAAYARVQGAVQELVRS